MAYRIDTVEGRSRLKPRPPPYWQKLTTGCHLGFRKMSNGPSQKSRQIQSLKYAFTLGNENDKSYQSPEEEGMH